MQIRQKERELTVEFPLDTKHLLSSICRLAIIRSGFTYTDGLALECKQVIVLCIEELILMVEAIYFGAYFENLYIFLWVISTSIRRYLTF